MYPNQMKMKPFYFLANKVVHNRGLLLKLKRKKGDYSFKNKDVFIFISSSSIES